MTPEHARANGEGESFIPNQFMERNRITQSTVVEDFMYKFHNCTVFSKLDMKQRYHQLLLDPESRKIATFSTPWGNMRPKRLIFGAKSSQDLFDEAIYRIFWDIPRCQVTTRQHRTEPIKSTETPKKPWDVVAVDFGGPYPDGHYNLLAIDKRTRYPEVSKTHSPAFRPTKDRLKTIFATHGTPRQLESDNEPPFNSKEFAEFPKTEGFHHHRVTPEHARANGEAESFMKLLNKTEQIAHLQGGDSNAAIQEMLTGYRSTPHPATVVTPYEALMNRQVRTKLDHQTRESNHESACDSAVNKRDKEYKQKTKQNAQNKNTKQHNFTIGDHVLLKQKKTNKWATAFEPAFYTITQIDGSSMTGRVP